MGGLTFESPGWGPLPFTTLGTEQRRLLLEALVATEVYWEVSGPDCPDCLYAHVTRASVLQSLEAARLYACREQGFLRNDPTLWSGSRTSREIFFEVVNGLLETLEESTDPVLIVTDDYTLCDHPNLEKQRGA